MSTTYRVKQGDTFQRVSRRVYGSEQYADRINKSNPGVSEPLVVGTILITPEQSDLPTDSPVTIVGDGNQVSLLIDNTTYKLWQNINITRSIDAFDTISISVPFTPSELEFRTIFKPLSFKTINVVVGGDNLFRGTMINIEPLLTSSSKTISVSGYSTPGVLNDCTVSANDYPVEFDESDLQVIAGSLALPFGVDVQFDTLPGAVFERVGVEVNERVLGFLIRLAQQRGLLTSSTVTGKLLFQKETAEKVVARLTEGFAPMLGVESLFDPQSYYSHVTGIEPSIVGLPGNQYTKSNPLLNNVIRPLTYGVNDTQGGTIQSAVEAKAGRMFANVVTYIINVATWRDVNDQLWEPNTLITVNAPGAMIYSDYTFLIRKVSFNATPLEQTATLHLVLPGSFKGEIPESLPWD